MPVISASTIWISLAYGWAVLCAAGIAVQASGYFPRRARPRLLRGRVDDLLILLLILCGLALLLLAFRMAFQLLSWPVAVIAGGLAILVAPLLWQILPRALLDRRAGIVAVAAVAAGTAQGLALLQRL